MDYPKVSIVTPIHDGISYTLKFLKSLEKVSYPNFEIIIIDDGSTDNSAEIIKEKYPKVIILKGDGNLWWSAATNLGVKEALKNKADYIVTINNDVEVAPDFLTKLIECAKEYPNSLIGSKIYEEGTQKLWYYGGIVDWKRGEFNHNLDDKQSIFNADWLTGMGVLIKQEVFKKIGFYNAKKVPQYFGDLEFSMRAKKNGYNLIVSGKSIVYNNAESCGNIKYGKKLNFTLFIKSLFSIKSDTNIKFRNFVYKNYSPKPFKSLFNFYKNYFWGSLKEILRPGK